MKQPSAIIIGASSGIGLELCRHLAGQGYRLGIAARRKALLDEIAAIIPQVGFVDEMDIALPEEALPRFEAMMMAIAPVDFVFLCAGTGHPNPELKWELEAETVRINALGFAAMASKALSFFLKQGHGHLVGITSVAAARGSGLAPAYGASKAFGSHYLEALRIRARRSGQPIHVTEIRPGFVDTAMLKADRPFWVIPPAEAARRIASVALTRKPLAYVPPRWGMVAFLMTHMPRTLFERLG